MNTRLQVEHPVTEAVYGVDLVRMQFEVAAGASLEAADRDIAPRGHAIEMRSTLRTPPNFPSSGDPAADLPQAPAATKRVYAGYEIRSTTIP
jgi:biotin carboxylase